MYWITCKHVVSTTTMGHHMKRQHHLFSTQGGDSNGKMFSVTCWFELKYSRWGIAGWCISRTAIWRRGCMIFIQCLVEHVKTQSLFGTIHTELWFNHDVVHLPRLHAEILARSEEPEIVMTTFPLTSSQSSDRTQMKAWASQVTNVVANCDFSLPGKFLQWSKLIKPGEVLDGPRLWLFTWFGFDNNYFSLHIANLISMVKPDAVCSALGHGRICRSKRVKNTSKCGTGLPWMETPMADPCKN